MKIVFWHWCEFITFFLSLPLKFLLLEIFFTLPVSPPLHREYKKKWWQIYSRKKIKERENSHNCGWWRHKVDLFQGKMTKWLTETCVWILWGCKMEIHVWLSEFWIKVKINSINHKKNLVELHLIALHVIHFSGKLTEFKFIFIHNQGVEIYNFFHLKLVDL